MKIMVTGAGALLGQGIIRSLLESSLKPEILAVDPSALAAGLYWTPQRALIPMATDPSYLEQIESLIQRERPDAIMVGTDVELLLFARERERLEKTYGTHVIVSDSRVVGIADDKYLTFEFFKSHGFDAPDSALPGDEEALIERVGWPLIVKPRVGARSIGVSKVHNRQELAAAIAAVHNPVIQECVATDQEEFTAGVLCFDGRCDASIVMRRDLRDGNTYRAFVDHYPELNLMVRRMAESLRPYGPANFQFRLDHGKIKVFEINGRFSGTTPLRMRAGFNEVEMVLRHVLLGESLVQPTVQPMTILRYWTEVVVPESQVVQPS
ncbi:MAG: ATP-grasp domain-containing protein [Deltaproteobacteria bacterium]|nr:ATP-grasp domain-containing protein [Deltaproteobacteria bacterium]